jgi:sigma-E factor negative regulatory protein RseA
MSVEETLSAMLDDEAQDFEVRRLLRDMQHQPELRQRWLRQQLARAALHREPLTAGSADFVLSVRAAIEAGQPEVTAPGWRRALGGVAVAASVAAVVVFGGSQLADSGAAARVGPLPVGVVNSTGAVPVQASFGNRAVPAPVAVDADVYNELARKRLLRYSQEHAEHAALNTPAGLLPFARVPVIEP